MKKNLFVIAAVATVMVSCAESEMKTSFQDFEEAINFEEMLNKSTKSEIASVKDLVNAGGFQVWGYKAKNVASGDPTWSAKTTVFDGVEVTAASADAPEWTYTDKKYWDKTCSYRFFAAGANDHTNGTLSWANDKYAVVGAQSGKASTSLSDFVISRKPVVVNGETRTPNSKVTFKFHHIMAKVTFIIKNNVNESITVTGLKVTGFKSGNGTFAQTLASADTWSTLDCSEWTISGDAIGTYTLINYAASSDAVVLASADAQKTLDSYIMVPQEIAANALQFTLSYKIGDEEFTDHVGKIANAHTWGTDSHTTYTVKVGPEAIEFNVASVCDFCVAASGEAISIE